MSRIDASQRLIPSVLDRFLGTEDHHFGDNLLGIIRALQRDMEELLNTRSTHQGAYPPSLTEVHTSLLTYGLPDFGSIAGDNEQKKRKIAQLIEEVVERFEPRLKDVRVRLVGESKSNEMHLQFQLTARLVVEPHPDIAFLTELNIITGEAHLEAKS